MSHLHALIEQVKTANPSIGQELEEEVSRLEDSQVFGLVFERHEPEATELYGRPVRRGDKVHVLPERGSLEKPDPRLWRVGQILQDATPMAELVEILPNGAPWDADRIGREPATTTAPVDDLVCVAEHGDDIHMDLIKTGEVRRGGDDDPEHMVINAENLHALQLLARTHAGSVDVIYIDPPYNTGARDWKYNNDYVDRGDAYRHSKWLAFMERRLKLAKLLLNPEDSVLIVTIDEKEYLRLGLLLEQTFPEARIQMVSSVINPTGAVRGREFARTDEYLFFVMLGDKGGDLRVPRGWSTGAAPSSPEESIAIPYWRNLCRGSGSGGRRVDRPTSFYPVYVTTGGDPKFHSVGGPIALDVDPSSVPSPSGSVAVWPLRSDGSDSRWQVSPSNLQELIERGFVRLREANGRIVVQYLAEGERKKVEQGIFHRVGSEPSGAGVFEGKTSDTVAAPTQWNVPSHSARHNGSKLIASLLGDKRFDYPKSLYAVEDALRFFVADKPNATILDFFSGSGTTAHAVMRLNRQDGGKRRSISVTNNEVSAEEQAALIAEGLRPGDPEWEALGVAEHVTKPRVTAAITGRTAASGFTEPVKGRYKFTDEFDMADGFEANASFWTLNYLDPAHEL